MVGTPDLDKLLSYATTRAARRSCWSETPISSRPSTPAAACSSSSAPTCRGANASAEVWRMADPEERDASLALRAARGNRLRTAVKWYRDNGRLHTGDPIAMAADALDAYLTDRAAGKDALLVCDTWEIADALNRRLHHDLATSGADRDGCARPAGSSRATSSSADETTRALPFTPPRGDASRLDQVRNGNRWRVAALDVETNRVAAERLSDGARAVFDGDYLDQHVTLGYATTVHSAQGVTADTCYAILGEGASRAMAYVAMTRGRAEERGVPVPAVEQRSRP